jgi:hypothetical protein
LSDGWSAMAIEAVSGEKNKYRRIGLITLHTDVAAPRKAQTGWFDDAP